VGEFEVATSGGVWVAAGGDPAILKLIQDIEATEKLVPEELRRAA